MSSSSLPVIDSRARPLRDLRISVTDRCNFRCGYCMPKDIYGPGHVFLPRQQILSFEEITRVAKVYAELGVKKLRLTGGEPLLRNHLATLVGMLAQHTADLSLTTNGVLLGKHAAALKAAGLRRVTVSLDSLDDALFKQMSDSETAVASVLESIQVARDVGLGIKLNCVVRKGVNDSEITALAEYGRQLGAPVRFIEFMDVGITNGWQLDQVMNGADIIARLQQRWPLRPLDPNYKGEVARRYAYTDGGGEVGIITSVSAPFCAQCSRARLSADGHIYTCLFGGQGLDIKTPLREGCTDAQLSKLLTQSWSARTDAYSELRSSRTKSLKKVEMSYIGG